MAFPTEVRWIGIIALIVLLTATQELFAETHRRRYGLWRSMRQRRLLASPDERSLMWSAMMRRDPDTRVELSRLLLIAVAVLAFVGLLVLGPTGLTQRR